MNHKHRKVLHALFAHPVSANISPKAVEAVFGELGGEIEQRHRGAYRRAAQRSFRRIRPSAAQHAPDQVRQAKKFIEDAGIDPEKDYPLHGD